MSHTGSDKGPILKHPIPIGRLGTKARGGLTGDVKFRRGALMFDVGRILVVFGDAGVDDGVRNIEGISGVWSGMSSESCRGGVERLDVLRRRCTSGDNGVLVLLPV
jgi:hypothetical protein